MAVTNTNFYYNTTINGAATVGALSCSSLNNTGTLSSTSAATMGALTCSTIATSSGIVCGALTSSGGMTCGSITSSGVFTCGTSSATVGALSCSSFNNSGTMSNTGAATMGTLTCAVINSSGEITAPSISASGNSLGMYTASAGYYQMFTSSMNTNQINYLTLGKDKDTSGGNVWMQYARAATPADSMGAVGVWGGNSAITWNSSGRVGVGSGKTPGNESLEVSGNATVSDNIVSSSGTVYSHGYVIKNTGSTSYSFFSDDGLTQYGDFAHAGAFGHFFTDSSAGDLTLRNCTDGRILLGAGTGSQASTVSVDSSYMRFTRGDVQNSPLIDFRNIYGWGIHCTTSNENNHGGSLDFKYNDFNVGSSGSGTALSISATGKIGINTSCGAFTTDALNINGSIFAQTSVVETISKPARFLNTSGQNIYIALGQLESPYQCAYFSFVPSPTVLQDSVGRLGVWGKDDIITWNTSGAAGFAKGRVAINKSPDTNSPYALDISGDCRVLGAITSSNLVTSANGITLGPTASNGSQTNSMMFSIGSTLQQNGQSNEIAFASGAQAVYTTYGIGGSWSWTSDEQLKTEIEPSPLGLEFIKAIIPIKFKWNEIAAYDTKTHHAFSYQQLKKVCEDFNTGDIGLVNKTREYGHVAPSLLIAPLVNAVKELSQKIDELSARLLV